MSETTHAERLAEAEQLLVAETAKDSFAKRLFFGQHRWELLPDYPGEEPAGRTWLPSHPFQWENLLTPHTASSPSHHGVFTRKRRSAWSR